ncbi:MAG: glycosyltransferase family 9 protein [Thermoanaerobaculaceae bacterium]|jgi:ADP-heptose:LPS heptosyltransferase
MASLPARLLVDLPNWLGDFVHTLPALAALKKANRGGDTTALLPVAHAPLARLLGVTVIVRPVGAGFSWARRCLFGSFDVALTARHSSRAKLLLAGTGARTCLASEGRGAAALGLVTFPVVRRHHQRHDLDGALKRLGMQGVSPETFRLQLPEKLNRQGLSQRALLADLPGMVAFLPATRESADRRYPARNFLAVAAELAAEGITPVVVVGPGEERMATPFVTEAGAHVAPTAWPLHEIAALLAACDAAVGNDSGLTHLAAVVGCPTVALFGPTDPARTAPVGGGRVLQPPARAFGNAPRLEDLDHAEVLAAVRATVAERSALPCPPVSGVSSIVALETAQRYDWTQRVGR